MQYSVHNTCIYQSYKFHNIYIHIINEIPIIFELVSFEYIKFQKYLHSYTNNNIYY